MAEETKREMPVQSSGFMTMGMGDHVLVRQRDGSWKAGAIVDCYLTYTVMYEDGSHGTLDNKTFTLQRVVRAGTIAPGMNVLVPQESGDVRCCPGQRSAQCFQLCSRASVCACAWWRACETK